MCDVGIYKSECLSRRIFGVAASVAFEVMLPRLVQVVGTGIYDIVFEFFVCLCQYDNPRYNRSWLHLYPPFVYQSTVIRRSIRSEALSEQSTLPMTLQTQILQ